MATRLFDTGNPAGLPTRAMERAFASFRPLAENAEAIPEWREHAGNPAGNNVFRPGDLIGLVVIGRNEGERLQRCLQSVMPLAAEVVYVDSGSTDASVYRAQRLGAEVVCLDMSHPFTAARARNQGFQRLMILRPELRYVQFVDGDCEVDAGWLPAAVEFLEANPGMAAISGRLREKHPEHSIYNRLCDLEWDAPAGEALAVGGNAMFRVAALLEEGGFRADMIAGEEPELCVRLRARGWRIWRLEHEMARHDAAMTRFGQWWRRSLRCGYAYAEGAHLHGHGPARHWRRESFRSLFWGGFYPLTVMLLIMWRPAALLLLALYPLQVMRIAWRGRDKPGLRAGANWWQALFLVLGKFPECLGALKFLGHHLTGQPAAVVEHK